MNITQELLRKTVYDRQKLDDEAFTVIESLVANHPFGEKIVTLLINQQLATQSVPNRFGRNSQPNCIGTAFFVAGVSTLPYPYYACEDELDAHMKIPVETPVAGAFVFSFDARIDDWHAGVYLGEANKNPFAFSQNGHGGPFGIEMIHRHYSRPRYYLPQTLV